MHRTLSFVVGFCLVSLAHAQGSQVWIVDAGGAGDFLDLQPAINAAAPGDAIRLRPAPLPYSASYIDKSLTIVGEGAGRVAVGEMWLRLAEDVVLRQLSIEPSGFLLGTAAVLLDGAHRVWIEDCEVRPAAERNSSILAAFASDIVLVRCQVDGGTIPLGFGIDPGLGLQYSEAHAFDCSFAGSTTPLSITCPAAAGGGGASVGARSTLFAVNTTFQGGRGAFSNGVLCPSGTGGPGFFGYCYSESYLLNCDLMGGFGGRGPSPGFSGPPFGLSPFCAGGADPVLEQGVAPVRRSRLTPATVSGGGTAELEAQGVPGDLLFSLFSTERTGEYLPEYLGSLVLGPPYVIVQEGVLPASGQLARSFVPSPPPPVAVVLFHQSLFFGTSGQATLADPSAVLLVP